MQRFNPLHRSAPWRACLLNGRDSASLLCIYVGRLSSENNIQALLSMARLPEIALTIIGAGPYRQHLETVFQGTETFFARPLSGEDLACAFAVMSLRNFRSDFGFHLQQPDSCCKWSAR